MTTSKGPSNEETIVNRSSIRTSDDGRSSSNYSHDDDDNYPIMFRSRKSYPQRHNRPKLNYRDLERGMYNDIRQSMWALGGPQTETNRDNEDRATSSTTPFSDDEEDDEIPAEEDNDEDESEQMHRRLWCICKKPWDHARVMLRCDSCANWYHGDCIGVTKEQARALDMNGEQFVCPLCKGKRERPKMPSSRSSDESLASKRKRTDVISPGNDRKIGAIVSGGGSGGRNGNVTPGKSLSRDDQTKRQKTGIFFHRDPTTDRQIHCIVHGCTNWAKSSSVYCSSACIRRHINDTLQAIQRSKGEDNDNPPIREDILLYESKTKKVLDSKLVPKVEDLCNWINQHPSYEIIKPALRQSVLLNANETKPSSASASVRPSPSTATPINVKRSPTTPTSIAPKQKLSWAPVGPNQVANTKPLPLKKTPVQLGRQTSNPTTPPPSTHNTADIRSKVPTALYDKLLVRMEKGGDPILSNDEIRTIAEKIEEEMFRVFGKVDNAYRNKFRSLLANITNSNNNYFYKQVLSKELNAKQIVAMKPEDMLPPEEKEKRKDEFQKEVEMIIKAEAQTAEELARRARMKVTRQGLVDNDAVLPTFKKETHPTEEKVESKISVASGTNKTSTSTKKTGNNTSSTTKSSSVKVTNKPIGKTSTNTVQNKRSVPSAGEQKVPKDKPKISAPIETSAASKDTTSSHGRHTFDINCSICTNPTLLASTSLARSTAATTEHTPRSPKGANEAPPLPSSPPKIVPSISSDQPIKPPASSPSRDEPIEATNNVFATIDLDDDYIEPESPTGIDALIYDDDDDINNTTRSVHPTSLQQQHSTTSTPDSPSDSGEHLPSFQQPVRDDYNPLTASKNKTDSTSNYQPTPIIRSSNGVSSWRGSICPPDASTSGKIQCQSLRIYGEADYLISDLPEQLGVLGRLKLADLWDYVRDSLAVRDVLILSLVSLSSGGDNGVFQRYVDTMRTSERAAVISKRTEPSSIRDMYVLAADMKDCPPSVLFALTLPTIADSKQLFLVIIGSVKRTTKLIGRSGEIPSTMNFTYKPASLQDSTPLRDPRLLRNKDPRLGATETVAAVEIVSGQQPTNNNKMPNQSSDDDLIKLISDSLDRVRHSSNAEAIRPIVTGTLEKLKANGREDLCMRFNDDLRVVMTELDATRVIVAGDNLTEENMDVDDEQDEKQRKHLLLQHQQSSTSTTSSTTEFNDVDYRFLGQDIDHRTTTHDSDHRHKSAVKPPRKSRFSDVPPVTKADRDADDRRSKAKLPRSSIPLDSVFSKDAEEEEVKKKKTTTSTDSDLRATTSADSTSVSLSGKFRPIIESFASTNTVATSNVSDQAASKPIRFTFSKGPLIRRRRWSIPSSTMSSVHSSIENSSNADVYESSPQFIEALIEQVQKYGFQGLSLANVNWAQQTLPLAPTRATAMLAFVTEQRTNNRSSSFSSGTCKSVPLRLNNHAMTHYQDFDRPDE